MDIWTITVEPGKPGIDGIQVEAGQTLRIVRLVTLEYIVNVSDYLDEADETAICLETLIEREKDTMGVSDVLDNEGKASIIDDTVISVFSE